MTNTLQEMTRDMQARVRELAYMMWESAGRQHGMAMEYWLKAESEVMSTLQAAASKMMPGSLAHADMPVTGPSAPAASEPAIAAAALTPAPAPEFVPVSSPSTPASMAAEAALAEAPAARKPAPRKPAGRAKKT